MLPTQSSNFTFATNNPLNTNLNRNSNTLLSNTSLNLATQSVQSFSGASQSTHTFIVTNTNDQGAGSLRQAILDANADSLQHPKISDVIRFNLGAGAHTITLSSAALDITAQKLTINGIGANVTIDGNHTLQDFVIESGASVKISGLTITNGLSTTNGGGILNNGKLVLNNSTVSNNAASTNSANGGGIFNNGTFIANGDTFTNNTALTGAGGAILNVGTATITNSSFANNSAVNGGAIESLGTLTLTNSTFTDNIGTGGFGGAVVGAANGKVTITSSSFIGNLAAGGFGGAILNNNTSTLKVTNSSFTNNQAGAGAAIYNDNPHGAIATALGLTFSGNLSTGSNGSLTNNNDTYGSFVATVDTLVDTNDGNFAAGHLSLRNAITGAIAGETINFAPNLANGTITLTQGELAINKSLTIEGLGANKLTIDGNHHSRDFNIGVDANVTITGLNIINGSSGYNNFGGGIYNQGILTLSNDIISGNTADLGGGGIFNNQGTVTLSSSFVNGNTGGNGGGLENAGGTVTVSNTNFVDNISANGLGGGISNSGTLTLSGSSFNHNTALIGGGGLFNNGTANLASSSFTNNSTQGKGGAILNGAVEGLGNLTITGLTFAGNQAVQATGVIGDTVDISGPVTVA